MNRRAARREVFYWPANGPRGHMPQPDRGRLPIVLLSGFCIATTANGFSLLIGLPFLFSVLVVIVLCWLQMSFVRYQPPEQRSGVNGNNSAFGYFMLGIIFTSVMAFGLYGIGAEINSNELNMRQSNIGARMFKQGGSPNSSFDFAGESEVILALTPFPSDQSRDTPPTSSSNGTLEENREISFIDFIRATMEKDAYAIACWLIAGFIEVVIFLLVRQENHDFELWR